MEEKLKKAIKVDDNNVYVQEVLQDIHGGRHSDDIKSIMQEEPYTTKYNPDDYFIHRTNIGETI